MITLLIFLFFGALAVVSAVLVILQRNAMHSVLYLAFTVLAVSGVFFCFQAEYLGAIQILVYGGGIVVLYVFVIVIVNLKEIVPEKRRLFPKIFIVAMPALLLAEIVTVVVRGAPGGGRRPRPGSGAHRAGGDADDRLSRALRARLHPAPGRPRRRRHHRPEEISP